MGVFLKDPRPGGVKTRLGRAIGMAAAAEVYRAFAADVVEEVATVRGARVTVFYDPPEGRAGCEEILTEAGVGPSEIRLAAQSGSGLGARMRAAFDRMLETAPAAVLVGTDLPTLTSDRLEEAFQRLESAEVVFGPAVDGGYYLLGLKRGPALERTMSQLLEEIPWSTARVLKTSVDRLARCRVPYELLARERDVDTIEDLVALRDSLDGVSGADAARTKRVCAGLERSGPGMPFAGPR